MSQHRMSRELPQVPPSSPQRYGAQFSRQPSISSINTVSTTNTFGRRPPSYATHESVDDHMDYRWPRNEDSADACSVQPPSYQTPSVYEEDEEDPFADPPSLAPLRYAPSANFLENQFTNASSLTVTTSQDDSRAETPTLQNLRISDMPQQELHQLSWDGREEEPTEESIQIPTIATEPPEYSRPASFSIGGVKTEALVSAYHISGHLSLMYEFWCLRNRVEGLDNPADQPVTPFPEDKGSRWAWLVSFAVDRFSIWCQSLRSEDVQYSAQEIMPPIDVLMIWHSYLLNPSYVLSRCFNFPTSMTMQTRRYLEDCRRIPCLRVLAQLGRLRLVPALGGELLIMLDSAPTEIRKQTWHTKTQGRAFDIFEDARQSRYKVIKCPDCEAKIEHPYMDSHGTGYLQHKFECYCSNLSCSFIEKPFDKKTLGARKLADDIVRYDNTLQTYLAGTLWTGNSGFDQDQAARIKNLVNSNPKLECPKVFTDEEMILSVLKRYVKSEVLQLNDLIKPVDLASTGWAWELLKQHKYSVLRLIDSVNASLTKSESISVSMDICRSYMDGDIFSLDLVGAVLRQSSFVQQMYELGWSRPGFFAPSENEMVLQHTVARYHAFLDLVAVCSKHKTLVPTLDIDLAWHTHQLFGVAYHDHCKKYVHCYLDHYDKIEETRLAVAFDETSRAWRSRFKVPYSFCGCPQPGKRMFVDVPTTDAYDAQKVLLKPRSADDIVFQIPTHPSDHNAVYDNRRHIDAQSNRKARLEKRSKRETREEGLLEGLTKGKSKLGPHDPAFFATIPDWYFKSTQRADCVLYSAHTLDSEYIDFRKTSPQTAALHRYSDLIDPTI